MRETDNPRQMVRWPGDIGRAVRARRKTLGLSQEDVAAQVGVSRVTVGAIENGKDTAHVGIVMQLCADLGLRLAVLDADDET